ALAGLPRRLWLVVPLALVGVVAAGWASKSNCTKESAYYCIRVEPGKIAFTGADGKRVVGEPAMQTLFLDHLVHALVDLSDPTDLLYNYENEYAEVLAALHAPGSRIDAFFAGGGGYVFPRYVEARYRGPLTVAEIDPAVTRIAREYLGLQP